MTNPKSIPNITTLGKDASGLLGQVDLGQLAIQLITAADTWVKVVQREATTRVEIRAWEATQRESIIAQRDVLLKGLDLTFDERRETFRRLFDSLDDAMKREDAQIASDVLEKITDLAKASPFKDLGNVRFVVDELKKGERTWTV
ncbi:hypothetical protein E3O19_01830 [Cryobacterium algoritolerans]|uniref:Uncharacterized protein n=1 Tax=Cryobacterium algoritolerans TaxID=1259184 RepID=A0A4R8WZH1_9MICO|nr:hypothetical protein [Cryobacterium algoritolerans]TFC19725.1 hypothetical protein E3O19_01830 [Cryobacterium algoritolerans]